MDNKSPNKNILIVGFLALIAIIGAILYAQSNGLFAHKIAFGLKSPTTTLAKGDSFAIDVVLLEDNEKDVTAYDIQLDYNKDQLKLISAKPGNFFTSPMVVKWDVEQAWFAAAASPSGYKDNVERVNPGSSLLTVEFMALTPIDKTTVSIKNTSQVYLYQKGVIVPQSDQIQYKIN